MEIKPTESKKCPDEGSMKLAVHGLFAKVQEKTGLADSKIDEFQKKWLEIPETRTKYRHWWDAPAIGGEELYAMFNDIIDFVQAQEVGQSHVFSSLREESEQILKDPKTYFHHLVDLGKGWMGRGVGWAKSWMNHDKKGDEGVPPSTKIEESTAEATEEKEPEEELSAFEKAEMEDEVETEGKPAKTVGAQKFVSRPASPKNPVSKSVKKAKPVAAKAKKPTAKRRGN